MKKVSETFDPAPICERLKKLRATLGFKTPKSFAYRLGLNYTTYRNYEEGRMPPAEFLALLKNEYAYGVNLDWLMTGQEIVADEESDSGPRATADLDIEVLAEVIKGVEKYLNAGKKTLDPDPKGRLIALLYGHFKATGEPVNEKTIVSYLKLVV